MKGTVNERRIAASAGIQRTEPIIVSIPACAIHCDTNIDAEDNDSEQKLTKKRPVAVCPASGLELRVLGINGGKPGLDIIAIQKGWSG
jgi:hypothetical protein